MNILGFTAPLLLFLAAPPAIAQCVLEIGTVADLKGPWRDLKYNRELKKNDVVCHDSALQRADNAKASAADFLKIKSRTDSQIVAFECKTLLGCERPLDLTPLIKKTQQSLQGASMLESFEIWLKSHNRKVTAMSRKGGTVDMRVLRTAVIEAGKPIPAVEAFRANAPAHVYQLDFCARPNLQACGETLPAPETFACAPGTTLNLPFAPPSAGVHILCRLLDADPAVRTNDCVLAIGVDPSRADQIADARVRIADAALLVSTGDASQLALFEEYVRSLANTLTARR